MSKLPSTMPLLRRILSLLVRDAMTPPLLQPLVGVPVNLDHLHVGDFDPDVSLPTPAAGLLYSQAQIGAAETLFASLRVANQAVETIAIESAQIREDLAHHLRRLAHQIEGIPAMRGSGIFEGRMVEFSDAMSRNLRIGVEELDLLLRNGGVPEEVAAHIRPVMQDAQALRNALGTGPVFRDEQVEVIHSALMDVEAMVYWIFNEGMMEEVYRNQVMLALQMDLLPLLHQVAVGQPVPAGLHDQLVAALVLLDGTAQGLAGANLAGDQSIHRLFNAIRDKLRAIVGFFGV